MLDLIFVGPLLLVVVLAVAMCAGRMPRPQTVRGWFITFAVVVFSLVWPLAVGVWPPDIFVVGSSRTLAEVMASSGSTYQIVQYWNHMDFYTTELRITSPNAAKKVIELDGDDQKSWSVPLSVDEAAGLATVTLSGRRTRTVSLHEGTVLHDAKA